MFRFISNVIILTFAYIGVKKVYEDKIVPMMAEYDDIGYNG